MDTQSTEHHCGRPCLLSDRGDPPLSRHVQRVGRGYSVIPSLAHPGRVFERDMFPADDGTHWRVGADFTRGAVALGEPYREQTVRKGTVESTCEGSCAGSGSGERARRSTTCIGRSTRWTSRGSANSS